MPRPTPRCLRAVLTIVVPCLLTGSALPSFGCVGDPLPFCGKSLWITHETPSVILLPAGGTLDIDATVYFDLWEWPPGGPIPCPAGPYSVDVDFELSCSPGPDATGSVTGVPITTGFNDVTVSVTLPAGPPRLCTVTGTVTTTLADGMVLTDTSTAPACIADPAPGNPTVPRLDFLLIDGDAFQRVHAGDQARYLYRVTNNDPNMGFDGLLTADMVNGSKRPGAAGPMPAGTGVVALSDPGLGDNFPIGFANHLNDGCLPLPLDPLGFTTSSIQQPVVLAPGETRDIEVFVRPWGMCADGSCGQGSLLVEGVFDDASDGFACSAIATAVDNSVAPQYLWPTGGQTGLILPPLDPQSGILTLQGIPIPPDPLLLGLELQPQQILAGGIPLPQPPQLQSLPMDDTRGRTQLQIQDGAGLFPANQPLDVFVQMLLLPEDPLSVELRDLQLMAPTGLEQIGPFAEAQVALLPPLPPQPQGPLAYWNLTHQVSGWAVDENDDLRPLEIVLFEAMPLPSGQGWDLHFTANVAPGTGTQIRLVDLFFDLHGFVSKQLGIFTDGLELGDTSRWTFQVP